MISSTNTQTLLTSGNEEGYTYLDNSVPTQPDLSSLLAVYYSDYDEHSWVLAYLMRYCW